MPNIALPLPHPRGGRLTPPDEVIPDSIVSPDILEAAGLRWIHIESPRSADRAWLEDQFDFHPLDYEDVYSRNQRPKLDQYDDYVFIVLHFPLFDKVSGRILTAELGSGTPSRTTRRSSRASNPPMRPSCRIG